MKVDCGYWDSYSRKTGRLFPGHPSLKSLKYQDKPSPTWQKRFGARGFRWNPFRKKDTVSAKHLKIKRSAPPGRSIFCETVRGGTRSFILPPFPPRNPLRANWHSRERKQARLSVPMNRRRGEGEGIAAGFPSKEGGFTPLSCFARLLFRATFS